MDKIKRWYRSVPIWLAFFLFALAGLGISAVFANWVTGAKYYELVQLRQVDLQVGEGYILADTGGSTDGVSPDGENTDGNSPDGADSVETSVQGSDGTRVERRSLGGGGVNDNYWTRLDADTPPDIKVVYNHTMLQAKLAPFLIYSAGMLLAALAFWFTKLRKPLLMLEAASERIAENELDFPLDYPGRDEMARLCSAFEKMRSALDGENRRMLRMIDEQHQLNDAYTHDLRTPIAVLKGYTDMLCKYIPTGQLPQEEVLDTLRTMSAQVTRLEQFASSMNTAQKLADVTPERRAVEPNELAGGLRETAAMVCAGSSVTCEIESRLGEKPLNVDPSAVTQVFENLLSNALRFARSDIAVTLEGGDVLTLRVRDDGPGFTEKELAAATRPYYCGQKVEGHFGLGLHICRTLCERHGGSLTLGNAPEGGASVTATFGF